jgi:hypothetical protein
MSETAQNNDSIDEGSSTSGQPQGRCRFLRLSQAHALYKSRKYQEVEAVSRSLLAADPDDVHAHTLLAGCLYQRGLIGDALKQVVEALAVWPNDEDLLTFQDILLHALASKHVGQRLWA